MKKLFLSMVVVLFCAVNAMAESRIATLTHDGVITAFYGPNALVNAHEQADNGDVITLSSGVFYAPTITKGITLRGAGMQNQGNVSSTKIQNDLQINIPEDVEDRLFVEGICFINNIYCNQTFLHDATFRRCTVLGNMGSGVNASRSGLKCKGLNIINCVIYWLAIGDESNIQVLNSSIEGFGNYGSSTGIFMNSLIEGCLMWPINSEFHNCIIYGLDRDRMKNSNVLYNCIYTKGYGAEGAIQESGNVALDNVYTIFKTYTDGVTNSGQWITDLYELTDEAKATYIGDDGTEVGMHGGYFPYDPTPGYPRITKFNVAKKTTADGKLSVDIEVSAAND